MKKVTLTAEVRTPLTPNFLSVTGISEGVPIAKFTDEQLQEIGERWTKELIAKAQARRKDEKNRKG